MRKAALFLVLSLLITLSLLPRPAEAGTPPEEAMAYALTSPGPDICAQAAALEAQDGPARASNTLTVMGDSWGFLFYSKLRETFGAHGEDYEFKLRAIPGTTAEQWADWPCLLQIVKSVIRDDPGTPTVLISLGGNDFVNDFPDIGSDVYARIEADLRTIVTSLIAERSDVVIVFSGYDVLNLDKTQKCVDMAMDLVGSSDPAVVNPYLAELNLLQGRVAVDYAQTHLANVAGALQGSPGNPDLSAWSPLRYFVFYPFWKEDCIHMSNRGYAVFTGAIYDWFVTNGLTELPAAAR